MEDREGKRTWRTTKMSNLKKKKCKENRRRKSEKALRTGKAKRESETITLSGKVGN